jgi:PAS domain S-box-containing protein
MTEAFFALDREWRLIYMNPVAEKMRTTPEETVLGKVLWDAFPDLQGTRFETEYRRAMRDNVVVQVEEHYPRMGRWFEAKAHPSEEGLSVYYRDITERKRVEARFERAFAEAPVGVVIAGEGGRLLQANHAFCRMLGMTEDELRGRTFEDVTAPEDLNESRAAVGELLHKGATTVHLDKHYLRADGTRVRARTTMSVVQRDPIEVVAHVRAWDP